MTRAAVRRLTSAEAVLVATAGALGLAVVGGFRTDVVAVLAALLATVVAWHRTLLRWDSLAVGIVLVILFIPIKRYQLPAALPFDLEVYRLAVILVLAMWVGALLVDPRVRLRSTVFDGPLVLIVVGTLASELANPGRVNELGSYVVKSLTFFATFVVLVWLLAGALRTRVEVDRVLQALVGGAAIVALLALWERQTGYNVFDHLSSWLPFLDFQGSVSAGDRAGRLRVIGPAQHPIALGALFATLVPVGVYLAHTKGRRWWAPTCLLGLGVLATGSRTAIIMILVSVFVFLRLKPVWTKRLWIALIPALVVAKTAVPGSIVTLKESFFPPGGLIAEQTNLPANADPQLAGGRVRLLGPSIAEASKRPLLGLGFGTRITGFYEPQRNAAILDNQWLGLLLEVGLVGIAGWLWLVGRATRRLWREARRLGDDPDSWLYTGLCASVLSFAVGMFTYDAMGFIQAAFVFWLLVGLSAVVLQLAPRPEPRLRGP